MPAGAQPQRAPKWGQFPLSLDRDHSHPPSSWEPPKILDTQLHPHPTVPTLPPHPQIRGLEPEASAFCLQIEEGGEGLASFKSSLRPEFFL